MVNAVMFLASYASFGGGGLGDLFAQWESVGIFSYALPFLFIYAVVFGLLMKINIFSDKEKNPNKGINALISLATALMALQFNFVSIFFAEISYRLGVALMVILVLIVLGGIFMPTNKKSNWVMTTLIILVFGIIIVVVYSSFRSLGLGFGGGFSYFWQRYLGIIIFVVLVLAVILTSTSKPKPDRPEVDNIFSKLLRGE